MFRDVLGSARNTVISPFKYLINLADTPVITLIYHRVTTLPSDPEMLAVSPENFRAQMRYLKDTVQLVRLESNWRDVSGPAVAVTFDDGYADNVLEALPILEEVGIPATFFISTGTIGSRSEFWWHELEHLILETHCLPASFTLEDEYFGRSWPTGDLKARQEFYLALVDLMTNSDVMQRSKWLVQLRRWAQSGVVDPEKNRIMTADELLRLAESPWVTIGAHTVTHTRLSSLPPDAQREEIIESKTYLERLLGREITMFSYPFGKRSHYSAETVSLCREAGFTKAAANFPGQSHRWTDPYQIPRHLVRNWPIAVFTKKLREFWTR